MGRTPLDGGCDWTSYIYGAHSVVCYQTKLEFCPEISSIWGSAELATKNFG